MDIRDMADLICIRDAYKSLNKSLFGSEMTLGFHEGNFGAMGRVLRVIERNLPKKLRKNDYKKAMKILDDASISPEARAKRLLGK